MVVKLSENSFRPMYYKVGNLRKVRFAVPIDLELRVQFLNKRRMM